MTHEQWVEGMAKVINKVIRRDLGTCFYPDQDSCDDCICYSVTAITAAEVALAFVFANMSDPTEQMLEAGRKAWKKPRLHVSHAGSDEFMTCGVIHRAMIEASGLKP